MFVNHDSKIHFYMFVFGVEPPGGPPRAGGWGGAPNLGIALVRQHPKIMLLGERQHDFLREWNKDWAEQDLKLVVSKGGSGQPELYDLATDIGESKDLASAQPAKVKELQALWDKWSAEQAPASTPDASSGGATKKNKKKKGK